ncbi:MAG: hypothetical protein ACPGYT_06875 [Nitrospirales bacterium]
MKHISLIVCMAAVMLTGMIGLAHAEWEAKHDKFINSWVVTDGNQQFRAANEKTAKKQAKAINKAEKKKAKKEGKGFKDDGDCPPGLRC